MKCYWMVTLCEDPVFDTFWTPVEQLRTVEALLNLPPSANPGRDGSALCDITQGHFWGVYI